MGLCPTVSLGIRSKVTALKEPCPCGSAFSRVDDIQGRLDENFAYAGGITVHPLVFRSPLSRDRNVVEYQVRQTVKGADIAIRCVGEVDIAGLADEVADALSELELEIPDVNVRPVDGFERTAVGKLKRFIPLT